MGEKTNRPETVVGEASHVVNFIQAIVNKDNETGKYAGKVVTRFPPEPNGYLHIGHAKSICLNFGIAQQYGGKCNLRFDDTNPVTEDVEYVDSIEADVQWLGFQWDNLFFASDYFETMYKCAVALIKKGKAYVCELAPDEMREYKGDFVRPGKDSPWRDRSIEENLDLFERMRAGEFKEEQRVLRAKIDMQSPNINMRDPVIYRILHSTHHRTGDAWCLYPMYDYAHPIEDAIENITHSICTLEFEDHRPFYDWVLAELDEFFPNPPQQIEFARLALTHTLMSKRYLKALVEQGKVDGWDDPRMSTVCGIRRRGVTPEAIRDFAERIGISKSNSEVDIALLEHCVREDLKPKVPGTMAVLKPLKLVITNLPEDHLEWLDAENNTENHELGVRQIPFTREVYIEADDFMVEPVKGYHRLYPGAEVRLRHAYFVKCTEFLKNSAGEVTEIHCTYDPETKSGSGFTGRKVKGVLHWVSAPRSIKSTVRQYDYLMTTDENGEPVFNEDSMNVMEDCRMEAALADAVAYDRFQFLRHGYFCVDYKDSKPGAPVFNQIVDLKSSWK